LKGIRELRLLTGIVSPQGVLTHPLSAETSILYTELTFNFNQRIKKNNMNKKLVGHRHSFIFLGPKMLT
jgi:hypothetical protein